MVDDDLTVFSIKLPCSGISRVALHNGGMQTFYQVANQRRFEVVGISFFAGGDFHAYLAFGSTVESIIDFHKILGRNVLDKEHGRHGIGSCGRHLLRLDLSAAQQRGYKREDGKKFIFHLLWALFFNSPEAQIIIEIFRILFQKIQLGESLPRCVF